MNFKVNIKVCRVCMKSEEGHSLFKDSDLQSKFVFTTRLSITPGDSMPNLICPKCVPRLKMAYDFIQLAHSSHKNLKAFLTKISNDFNEVTKISSYTKSSPMREDEISTIFDENIDENSLQEPQDVVNNRDVPKEKNAITQKPKPIAITVAAPIQEIQEHSISLKESKDEEDDTEEVVFYEDANFLEDESDFEDAEQKKIYIVSEVNDNQKEEPKQTNKKSDVNERFYGYLQEYNTMLSEQNANDNEIITAQFVYDEDDADDETAAPVEVLHIYEDSNTDNATDMLQENVNDNESVAVDEVNETCEFLDEKEDLLPIEDENGESSRADSEHSIEPKVDESSVSKAQKQTKQPAKQQLRSAAPRPKKAATKSTSINARFFCVKCNRDFSTKTNLTRHMITHGGKRPYQCVECGKSFSQNGSLKQHMMTHTGEKPWICEVCNRGFSQCKSLVFHMRRHTGEKPFTCDHCGLLFRQKDGLKTHILKHHMIHQKDGDTVTHTCTICKQLLPTKTLLHKHMKKHVNSTKTFNYQTYNTLSEENSLMEILADEDLINDKSFIKDELALNIEDVSASAQIVDIIAANTAKASRVKKFQCRKCYKCFAIKKNLLRHLTTHDVSAAELFQCTTCQVAFDTNYALRVHRVREHKETGINLNECEYCNVTFANANELSDHNNSVHDNLEEKCPECPDLHFKTQKLLMEHMLEHENLLNEIDAD